MMEEHTSTDQKPENTEVMNSPVSQGGDIRQVLCSNMSKIYPAIGRALKAVVAWDVV